jgi:hypothetical protein
MKLSLKMQPEVVKVNPQTCDGSEEMVALHVFCVSEIDSDDGLTVHNDTVCEDTFLLYEDWSDPLSARREELRGELKAFALGCGMDYSDDDLRIIVTAIYNAFPHKREALFLAP